MRASACRCAAAFIACFVPAPTDFCACSSRVCPPRKSSTIAANSSWACSRRSSGSITVAVGVRVVANASKKSVISRSWSRMKSSNGISDLQRDAGQDPVCGRFPRTNRTWPLHPQRPVWTASTSTYPPATPNVSGGTRPRHGGGGFNAAPTARSVGGGSAPTQIPMRCLDHDREQLAPVDSTVLRG
jgi:hypothetical protein